jgi:hypothetical protein
MDDLFDQIRELAERYPASRERALVLTKLDEAEMWFERLTAS